MRYRFEIDLRPGEEPPEDGFVPSGDALARPAPQVQEMPASEQLEAVYQRLCREVGRPGPGRHLFERKGYRHALEVSGNERILELRLSSSGSLVRRVYERMGGEPQSLDDLLRRGLSGLEEDEARFAAFPGYELRFARYSAREGRLVRVVMGRASFHAEHGGIVITAL